MHAVKIFVGENSRHLTKISSRFSPIRYSFIFLLVEELFFMGVFYSKNWIKQSSKGTLLLVKLANCFLKGLFSQNICFNYSDTNKIPKNSRTVFLLMSFYYFVNISEGMHIGSCWTSWCSNWKCLLGNVLPGTWNSAWWSNAKWYNFRGWWWLLQFFFSETSSGKHVLRAVFVDLEPSVVGKLFSCISLRISLGEDNLLENLKWTSRGVFRSLWNM